MAEEIGIPRAITENELILAAQARQWRISGGWKDDTVWAKRVSRLKALRARPAWNLQEEPERDCYDARPLHD